MFDQFSQLVVESFGWACAVILVFAAVDAVFPAVPSETVLVTAGVIAASQRLSMLPLAIGLGAAGAFAGDNVAYLIGTRYGIRADRRLLKGDKAQSRLRWAEQQLEQHGAQLITAGRFVPGGRTAITLAAGLTGFAWKRFAICDAVATVTWATYSASLGYFGGHTFEQQPWKGLLLALGIASTVTAGIWAFRRVARRKPAPTQL